MFAFGDAHYYGSAHRKGCRCRSSALTRTTTGHGYWLVGQHGEIYSFGDAQYYGSTPHAKQLIQAAVASRHS